MKRLFDICFSAFSLCLLSPAFLVIGCLIKLTSKGPIFFKSKRIGQYGNPTHCWKFRTMHVDAEKRLLTLLQEKPCLKKEWDQFQKLKKDPRLTPIGAFLRKTSLDEFPQFFDVLKGRLSVVGPRPFLFEDLSTLPEQIEKIFGDKKEMILSVKPGLTGLWQVSGRSLLSLKERLYLDSIYIQKKSFFYDLKLILKTITSILFPYGAF